MPHLSTNIAEESDSSVHQLSSEEQEQISELKAQIEHIWQLCGDAWEQHELYNLARMVNRNPKGPDLGCTRLFQKCASQSSGDSDDKLRARFLLAIGGILRDRIFEADACLPHLDSMAFKWEKRPPGYYVKTPTRNPECTEEFDMKTVRDDFKQVFKKLDDVTESHLLCACNEAIVLRARLKGFGEKFSLNYCPLEGDGSREERARRIVLPAVHIYARHVLDAYCISARIKVAVIM